MNYGQQSFFQRHWKKQVILGGAIITAGLYYFWGAKVAFTGFLVMVGLVMALGFIIMIERISTWYEKYHLQRKINQNSDTAIAPELNRFIQRILSQEKPGRHNAKNNLVNMLFGQVPDKLLYRVVNYDASLGEFQGFSDTQLAQVRRIVGRSKVLLGKKDRFDTQILIMGAHRFVPQFTLENGMTFVVIRVVSGDHYLDFEKKTTNVSFNGEVPHKARSNQELQEATTSRSRLDHVLN